LRRVGSRDAASLTFHDSIPKDRPMAAKSGLYGEPSGWENSVPMRREVCLR
jgi:hypothetical protein